MLKPKNIIILCIDALRFDCIGVEGNKFLLKPYGIEQTISTPTLDNLARQGMMFSQAISSANVTPPSIAGIMTGLFTPRHGIRQFFKNALHPGIVTLAQLLTQSGYTTIAGDELPLLPFLDITKRGMDHTYRAFDANFWECIQANKGRNLFLFLHLMDVHDPYMHSWQEVTPVYNEDYENHFHNLLEKEHIEQTDENPPYILTYRRIIQKMFNRGDIGDIYREYIRGINKFDAGRLAWIIKFFKNLKLLDDSLLIIVADHGEGPGKYAFTHGIELYDGQIRVPLIMIYPGIIPQGKTIETQVRTVDIFPTILSYLGISPDTLELPYSIDGEDLAPIMAHNNRDHRDAFFEIWSHSGSDEDMIRSIDSCSEPGRIGREVCDWNLYQTGMRTPEYKCIIQGDDFPEEHTFPDSGNEEFVRSAYRKILRRKEDSDGFRNFVHQLDIGTLNRSRIIECLTNSEEYKNLRILYDLTKDPFETDNLLAKKNAIIYQRIFNAMHLKIESLVKSIPFAESEETAYESEEERETIEGRLKALGYL